MNATVSVVMTTYEGDNPQELHDCFISLNNQIRKPNELIIVRDEKLPSELTTEIKDFEKRSEFSVRDISVEERGRGHARGIGVKKAESELVAIIDADDIACPNRLKRQLEYFESNPSTDAVGGYIGEFVASPDKIQSIRKLPIESEKIYRTAYYRSPMNHPTVTFRRSAVLDVGNYREMEYGEDYELWCRLLQNGKELANIPEILVKARATELTTRRQGVHIARREIRLIRSIVNTGFYGWILGSINLAVRVPIRLFPERLLSLIYQIFFRS